MVTAPSSRYSIEDYSLRQDAAKVAKLQVDFGTPLDIKCHPIEPDQSPNRPLEGYVAMNKVCILYEGHLPIHSFIRSVFTTLEIAH